MSRIGKKPVVFPADVKVSLAGQVLTVAGANGELKLDVHPNIAVTVDDGDRVIQVSRPDDPGEQPEQRQAQALELGFVIHALINQLGVAGQIGEEDVGLTQGEQFGLVRVVGHACIVYRAKRGGRP